jgi:Rrf2 family protein
MKLSKRGEYGLRTLIKLGIAHTVGRELVSASELAQLERLPLKFVEQILADLRQDGIVGTKRGKYGGYFLEASPDEIKIGRVVRLLDGMLAPIPCASESFYQPCTCEDEAHCGLRMLMIDVRNAVANILDRYTLGNVVEVTLRKMRRDNLPIPFTGESTAEAEAVAAAATQKLTDRRHADPSEGFLALLTEGHEAP